MKKDLAKELVKFFNNTYGRKFFTTVRTEDGGLISWVGHRTVDEASAYFLECAKEDICDGIIVESAIEGDCLVAKDNVGFKRSIEPYSAELFVELYLDMIETIEFCNSNFFQEIFAKNKQKEENEFIEKLLGDNENFGGLN